MLKRARLLRRCCIAEAACRPGRVQGADNLRDRRRVETPDPNNDKYAATLAVARPMTYCSRPLRLTFPT